MGKTTIPFGAQSRPLATALPSRLLLTLLFVIATSFSVFGQCPTPTGMGTSYDQDQLPQILLSQARQQNGDAPLAADIFLQAGDVICITAWPPANPTIPAVLVTAFGPDLIQTDNSTVLEEGWTLPQGVVLYVGPDATTFGFFGSFALQEVTDCSDPAVSGGMVAIEGGNLFLRGAVATSVCGGAFYGDINNVQTEGSVAFFGAGGSCAGGTPGCTGTLAELNTLLSGPNCAILNTNYALQECNDNGTDSDATDDYITFLLEPTAQEVTQTAYNVTVDNGGTVTRQDGSPATNIAYSGVGSAPALRLQNGSADGTTQYTITLTDVSDASCTITQVVAIQTSCSVSLVDTDMDNVPDITDVDDDNDGILDTIELGCTTASSSSFNPLDEMWQSTNLTITAGQSYRINLESSSINLVTANGGPYGYRI